MSLVPVDCLEEEDDLGRTEETIPRDHSSAADRSLRRRPWRRSVTLWSEIVQHPYAGKGFEDDPHIVTWLPEDAENPQDFSRALKWGSTMIAAFATMIVAMGSSLMSAAVPSIEADFPGRSSPVYIMVTSSYVIGFVIGPLFWAPCSEVFGRRTMFIVTYLIFTAFDIGVAACRNLPGLLVLRFFAGTFGSSTMTNSGGIIADMFDARQRGLALGYFAVAPFLGPAVGPVAGGFLSERYGWQWAAALIALIAFAMALIGILFLPETYSPVLLRRRAARLSNATGSVYRSLGDAARPLMPRQLFLNQLSKPWVLFFKEPIVFLTALYLSIIYAILYMSFTSFPLVFEKNRGWSPGIAGLAFLGITSGALLAIAYILFYENPRYTRKLAAAGGYLAPEERLQSVVLGAGLMPIGLIVFAWTGVPVTIPWIVPILATVPFGMGFVFVFLGISNYLVDTYLLYAASVLAGGTVVRSIVGVVLPLFTTDIYDKLGIRWAGTLVAGLALLLFPIPLIFFVYGKRIRGWSTAASSAETLALQLAGGAAKEPKIAHQEPVNPLERSMTAQTTAAAIESDMLEAADNQGGIEAIDLKLSQVQSIKTLDSRAIV